LEISSRDLTQFLNLNRLKTPDYQPNLWNWCPFPTPTCICNMHGSTCLALARSQTFSRQWGLGGQLVFQLGTEYCVTYRHGGRWSMSVVWGRGVSFWRREQKSVVSFVHSYSHRKIRCIWRQKPAMIPPRRWKKAPVPPEWQTWIILGAKEARNALQKIAILNLLTYLLTYSTYIISS
jgi:hypothetical protein